MPQASKSASSQRAQEKESKRARGAMSCAECRRLKLKCDKLVPCSSCTRRGCSEICPNGSLVTGQGTRFVLADTAKLHTKISQMSDRIRQLEDSLSILQSMHTNEPHPLLSRELLSIKSSLELHAAAEDADRAQATAEVSEESQYIDAFGTLAIREDGAATFYGRSAGTESLLIGEHIAAQPQSRPSTGVSSPHSISSSHFDTMPVLQASSSFPFSASTANLTMDTLRSYLPPWDHAWELCQLYLEINPWFYGAVTSRQLEEEIIPMWYPDTIPSNSSRNMASRLYSTAARSSSVKEGDTHDLALMFIIFCFGALVDTNQPAAPDNPEADRFYHLTKAALAVDPPIERLPSMATVQALSMMGIYQGLCNGENNIEAMWALFGLSTKLAQSIGLHKDSARWKLPPSEVQKRRALFFELLITDGWQSLATGRLPTFSLPFVDCELPSDPDQTLDDEGNPVPSFPFWKARFGAECVSAVVQGTLTSRAPKYSIILDLDRKVRDMELPKYAQGPHPENASLAATMSHFMPQNYRELSLLYIHRCFFAHAISSHPHDPIKSPYAPSFLAGYQSARTIINSLRIQFSLYPKKIARFWVLWTHAFSGAVMLASVVTHASKSKVSGAALVELKAALELFRDAASEGGRAVKFLPIVERLWDKAHQTYLQIRDGAPAPNEQTILTHTKQEPDQDELSIFSGKTHTVVTKVSQNHASPSSSAAGVPPHSGTPPSSFVGAHPSLVNQYNGFDSQIDARIQEAWSTNSDVFAHSMESPSNEVGPSPQLSYPSPSQSSMSSQAVHSDPSRPIVQQRMSSSVHVDRYPQTMHAPMEAYSNASNHPEIHRSANDIHHSQNTQYEDGRLAYGMPVSNPSTSPESVYQSGRYENSLAAANPHAYMGPPSSLTNYSSPQTTVDRVNHESSGMAHAAGYSYPQYPDRKMAPPEQYEVATYTNQAQYFHPDPLNGHPHSQSNEQQYAMPTSNQSYPLTPPNQNAHYQPVGQSVLPQQYLHTQNYYTTDGFMKDIAAEDSHLQETWIGYMNQMGSPRQFQDKGSFSLPSGP